MASYTIRDINWVGKYQGEVATDVGHYTIFDDFGRYSLMSPGPDSNFWDRPAEEFVPRIIKYRLTPSEETPTGRTETLQALIDDLNRDVDERKANIVRLRGEAAANDGPDLPEHEPKIDQDQSDPWRVSVLTGQFRQLTLFKGQVNE